MVADRSHMRDDGKYQSRKRSSRIHSTGFHARGASASQKAGNFGKYEAKVDGHNERPKRDCQRETGAGVKC